MGWFFVAMRAFGLGTAASVASGDRPWPFMATLSIAPLAIGSVGVWTLVMRPSEQVLPIGPP